MASLIDSPGSSEPPEPFAGSVDFACDVDDGDEHAPSTTMATHTRVTRNWLVRGLLKALDALDAACPQHKWRPDITTMTRSSHLGDTCLHVRIGVRLI